MQLPVRAVSADEVTAILLEKAGRDAMRAEVGVAEVAAHRVFARLRHRERMVGAAPALGLPLVATGTDLAADVAWRRRLRYRGTRNSREQDPRQQQSGHTVDEGHGHGHFLALAARPGGAWWREG